MSVPVEENIEDTLAGRPDLVAVGVGLDLLPAVVSARRRTDGGRWRIACPPGVVDELGRTFALGTAVVEARSRDEIDIRTASGSRPDRPLFATPDRVDALAGPPDRRTLVTETQPDRAAAAHGTATRRFGRADPTSIRMPGRTELLAAAGETLDDRFADDLATVLDSIDLDPACLDRSDVIDDRTLFVALAARHDHLFTDVREWADDVDIVEKQRFSDARRALENRGIIESIRVPINKGRPNNRLRALDETLIRVDPEEFLPALRERVRIENSSDGSDPRGADSREDDRPVWERRGR
ncbi:hypothetical protein J2751_001059 [Halorubrum alkaliphilum]|uniref:Uncharacterized protein n=1 Tax=Halorubrum alkaliphilum TaxID=261290 RepID=A0A8T4GC74_9EURY|nr:DUF5821 family protein [Halorubrum alkaliphilum]MBP1922054.1 hypothetical protein [Halorubrum alkaliphilum]